MVLSYVWFEILHTSLRFIVLCLRLYGSAYEAKKIKTKVVWKICKPKIMLVCRLMSGSTIVDCNNYYYTCFIKYVKLN